MSTRPPRPLSPHQLTVTGTCACGLSELLGRAAMPEARVKHGPGCGCTPCKAAYAERLRAREAATGE